MRKIILASTSPRRQKLLAETGLSFDSAASDYEEDMSLSLPPAELVKFLSKGKAEAVAKDYDDAVVIGADTIVYRDGQVFGKPHTKERAREMLESLSGNEHSVFTGYTIIDTKTEKIVSEAVETKIKFRKLLGEEIEEYLNTEEPLTRAGAYEFQTVGDKFAERVEGDRDNIIGLPVNFLMNSLKLFLN